MGTTASFMSWRSCASFHSPFGLWTPRTGVLQGQLHSCESPCALRSSNTALSPFHVSGFNEFCLNWGRNNRTLRWTWTCWEVPAWPTFPWTCQPHNWGLSLSEGDKDSSPVLWLQWCSSRPGGLYLVNMLFSLEWWKSSKYCMISDTNQRLSEVYAWGGKCSETPFIVTVWEATKLEWRAEKIPLLHPERNLLPFIPLWDPPKAPA